MTSPPIWLWPSPMSSVLIRYILSLCKYFLPLLSQQQNKHNPEDSHQNFRWMWHLDIFNIYWKLLIVNWIAFLWARFCLPWCQLRGWYEKDDVVAEWKSVNKEMCLHIHCFVSGPNPLLDLAAEFRYHIFSKEMPLVIIYSVFTSKWFAYHAKSFTITRKCIWELFVCIDDFLSSATCAWRCLYIFLLPERFCSF